MSETNFEKVSRMNSLFGKEPAGWDWEKIESQFHLIAEEFKETYKAIEERDKVEALDGLADLLVVTYGMFHTIGVNADLVMEEVNKSNLSKLCTTGTDLIATVTHYENLGVEVEARGELPEAYVAVVRDCTDHKGKFYPKDKFLKCVQWKSPNLGGYVRD